MNSDTYQVFRQPRNFDEFEDILKLRFEVFMEKGENHLFEQSGIQYGLDINNYDLCSEHFGLYENDELLIGTIRFIDSDKNPNSEAWISQLLKKYTALKPQLLDVPQTPFYVQITQNTWMEQAATTLLKTYRNEDHKMWETSRLAILKAYRGVKNVHRIIEPAYGFVVKNQSSSLFAIAADHKPIFQPLFNYPIVLSGEYKYGPTVRILVYCDIHCLHPAKRPKIEKMANALQETGQIVFHPDCPDYRFPAR